MRKMKKMISIALMAAMTLGLISSAWATDEGNLPTLLETNEMVLSEEADHDLILRSEDFENGDAKVYLIRDDDILYEAYLDRSALQIISKDYLSSEMRTTTFEPATQQGLKPMRVSGNSTGYINQGRITYNYYIQGMVGGQKYLDVAYNKTTNPYATYNLAGKYENIAAVTLFFVGKYGVTAKTGASVAKKVLSKVGIAVDAIDFFIGAFEVDAEKTTMEWKGSVNGRQMCKVTGLRYDFTLKGDKCSEYEQMYHGENSFKNHEASLANDLYTVAWGNDTFDVVSWS